MKYLVSSIILVLVGFFFSTQSEAAANFTMMPMLQGSSMSPNFNMAFPNASQMAASNLNSNLFADGSSMGQNARPLPQPRSNILPVPITPGQTSQFPPGTQFITNPQTGQMFALIPVSNSGRPINGLPTIGAPCPDFLGDTFACVQSPPGQPFIFQPISSNFIGGTCPDFLGDSFACVQSPRDFFNVPINPFIVR